MREHASMMNTERWPMRESMQAFGVRNAMPMNEKQNEDKHHLLIGQQRTRCICCRMKSCQKIRN
jgi:hypothetical protein